jgi:hypothetical protein
VECKEKDWSRAIRQARVYQGAAELVYVALPTAHASELARQSIATHGLGLLVVDHDGCARELLVAKPAGHLVRLLLDSAKRRFNDPRPEAPQASPSE